MACTTTTVSHIVLVSGTVLSPFCPFTHLNSDHKVGYYCYHFMVGETGEVKCLALGHTASHWWVEMIFVRVQELSKEVTFELRPEGREGTDFLLCTPEISGTMPGKDTSPSYAIC